MGPQGRLRTVVVVAVHGSEGGRVALNGRQRGDLGLRSIIVLLWCERLILVAGRRGEILLVLLVLLSLLALLTKAVVHDIEDQGLRNGERNQWTWRAEKSSVVRPRQADAQRGSGFTESGWMDPSKIFAEPVGLNAGTRRTAAKCLHRSITRSHTVRSGGGD
jgi:hypothetical protein